MRDDLVQELVRQLPTDYQLLNADGSVPAEEQSVVPLGEGGSSVVFRALHRQRLQRAIKLILPRTDLRSDIGSGHFADSFENEVVALSELSHEHIAKLTDVGTVPSGGKVYPFFVMEFVPGEPMIEFSQKEQTTGSQIFEVLEQLLSALIYMHSRGVMHCDLKTDNTLVRRRSAGGDLQISCTLLDLGVSRRILQGPTLPTDSYTYFFSTPRYVMPGLKAYLANHSGNKILHSELRKFFPWQDLHAFGVMLDDLLCDPQVSEKLKLHVGRRNFSALSYVRVRLDDPRPGSDHYQSAREVRDALRRVPYSSLAPLGIQELTPVPTRGIVLPTIQSRVPGSDRVDAFTSHPLFQRLQRLPQLDLLQYVLPGATHTRFAHGVHVYELARNAICHQLGDWQFRLQITPEDIESTMFSGLLDSVGRYHFQHMFEDFLGDRRQLTLKNAGLMTDHELLDEMLASTSSPFGEAFDAAVDTKGRSLREVFRGEVGMQWSDVRSRQTNPQSTVQGFLAALLSGPADVDKLAYLIDDSASTGLPFGKAVNPAPILEALKLPSPADWAKESEPRIVSGLREQALSYVENAVLTRYWNIQTGYWHRTNRALQAMVKFPIAALLRSRSFDFQEFILGTLHLSTHGALRWLDSAFCRARNEGAFDPETVNPLTSLLLSKRSIYQRLVTISPRSQLSSREKDRFIYEGIRQRSPLEDDKVCTLVNRALDAVRPGLELKPGEILLDLPRARREESGGKLLVYADNPGAELLGELYKISPVLAGLEQSFDLYAKRLRIFIHPRIMIALGAEFERAHGLVLGELREEFDGGAR